MRIFISLLLVSLLFSGCTFSGEEHSLIDKIKKESKVISNETLSSERFLKGVKRTPVQNVEGDLFFVVTRKDKIEKFSCAQCHDQNKPLSPLTIKGMAAAHWGNKMNHAREMSCKTCHIIDDMDKLLKLDDEKLDFNHSYDLCAQCHFQQHRDWVGGAHGKRVGGWAPPRVVLNCTSCHNPHSPAILKRWPKTYFRQLRLIEN